MQNEINFTYNLDGKQLSLSYGNNSALTERFILVTISVRWPIWTWILMKAGGTLAGRACCSWQRLLLKGHICTVMRRVGRQAVCPDVQKALVPRAVSIPKSTLQPHAKGEGTRLLSAGNRTLLPTSSFSSWFYTSQGWFAANISLGVLLNTGHLHGKQSVGCAVCKLQYLSGTWVW